MTEHRREGGGMGLSGISTISKKMKPRGRAHSPEMRTSNIESWSSVSFTARIFDTTTPTNDGSKLKCGVLVCICSIILSRHIGPARADGRCTPTPPEWSHFGPTASAAQAGDPRYKEKGLRSRGPIGLLKRNPQAAQAERTRAHGQRCRISES